MEFVMFWIAKGLAPKNVLTECVDCFKSKQMFSTDLYCKSANNYIRKR